MSQMTLPGRCEGSSRMAARPGSPNHNWQLLGYSVEIGAHKARTIRRPDGSTVDIQRGADEDAYTAELRASERELALVVQP